MDKKRNIVRLVMAALALWLSACGGSGLQVGSQSPDPNSNVQEGPAPVCGAQDPYLQTQTFFPGLLAYHDTGFLQGQAWEVNPSYPTGPLTFGPYTGQAPLGLNFATYTFQIDNNTADNNQVLWIDLFDSSKNSSAAIHYIHRQDFLTAAIPQNFQLAFDNTGICDLELRSIYLGYADIVHLKSSLFQPTTQTPYVANDGSLSAAFANNFVSGNANFTFSAWFNTTQYGALLGYQDVAFPAVPAAAWVPAIYIGTGGHLRVSVNTNPQVTSVNVVNDGTWHYVALVVSGGNQLVYLDGSPIGTVAGGAVAGIQYNQIGTAYTGPAWVGGSQGWFPFLGQLGNLGFHNTAYSAAQIQSDYLAGKPQ